jgi:hypothetical protein
MSILMMAASNRNDNTKENPGQVPKTTLDVVKIIKSKL